MFLEDADRRGFLAAAAELPERFGLEVHAFVLTDNQYHLLVRTGASNLSHAMRWLNVNYAVKFNRAHRWHGAVFAGRFKGILIQEKSKVVEVARYVHLNPVRMGGPSSSKREQRRAGVLRCQNPAKELIRRRLRTLREHAWSSWRIYMGWVPNPGWLITSVIDRACGGRSRSERRTALKAYTEQPILKGVLESPWEGLVGGVVLGDIAYARKLLSKGRLKEEAQSGARWMRRQVEWKGLVRAAEKIRGEPWKLWAERHADWGRDGVMYVAVRYGGMRLVEVVRQAGMKYYAAAQAVRRFAQALADDPGRKKFVAKLRNAVSTT